MKPTQYKKTLNLGKVDYEGAGKRNAVTITVELRGTSKPSMGGLEYGTPPKDLELSISGEIWDKYHHDIVAGGQCYDEILEAMPTPLVHEIVGIWKRWHLNSMNAGCEHQRDWNTSKDHPEGLLGKPCDVCGYKYGTEWKHEALPREVIRQVMNWEKSKELPINSNDTAKPL